MTTFNERENAFEARFAHDADMQFKAEARRNKLLGLWAAGVMGLSGAEADEYVLSVIKSDFAYAGNEDVVKKVAEDMGNKSTPEAIRLKMAEFLVQAKSQLLDEH